MSPRDQFQHLLEELRQGPDVEKFQAALEDEILDLHRERFPRRKAPLAKIPSDGPRRWSAIAKLAEKAFPTDFQEICRRHRADADRVWAERRKRKNEIEQELDKLADALAPEPGETWIEVHQVRPSDYHTQGFGAASYAKGSADRYVAVIKMAGIEAEVRTVTTPSVLDDRKTVTTYHVWAKCSELDYEIVKRRPMNLKDQLQWYWNRALNPRVYDPFLPHGLEEKLGVSFQPVRDAEGNPCP